MSTEAQIYADIEALRERTTETQELYREVCTILFFRYGITPTANKLYQYVRKGSMSAPAEALAKFWDDLREKSRVRIEHPDLPESVKTSAGDLVASLWTQAQAAAQDGLAAFRAEAQAAALEAKIEKEVAETDRATALGELKVTHQTIKDATEHVLQLERDLATAQAGKALLADQLAAAGRQQAIFETALTESRRDFSAELEKLRQALQRSEERHEAGEKRALLEIDRERTASAKLQAEVAKLRENQMKASEGYRSDVGLLQKELAGARQIAGVAEGTLLEMRAIYQQQAEQMQSLQAAVADGEAQKTLLERDLRTCQDKIIALKKELRQLSSKPASEIETAKPRRRTRNPLCG